MTSTTETPVRRGRPPKVDAPALAPSHEPAREPVREIARTAPTGRVQVQGRNGEILTRSGTLSGDQFEFDRRIVPDGWDYQWNQFSVAGEKQVQAQIRMYQAGWRPVPAERHPGVFMPSDYKGQIVREGQILEERPMALTIEAREEERLKAVDSVRGAREAIGLSTKLPAGFSNDPRYRGAGSQVRTTIGPAPDAERPQLQIAPD